MKSIARSEFAERLAAGETPETIFPEGPGGYLQKLLADAPPVSAINVSEKDHRINNVIMTNDTIDRYGDSLKPAGARFKNYLRNSVLLWCHDSSIPPIGRTTNVRASSSDVRCDLIYAPGDIYPLAGTVFKLMQLGFVNAVSIGLIPLKAALAKDKNRPPGSLDIFEYEIIELSVCPVPANPDALVAGRAAGIDTRPLVDWAGKVLDMNELQTIPRDELQALRRAAGAPAISESAAVTARRREARALAAKVRAISESISDPIPTTREQRLAEARNFRHVANTAGRE
jgi:HK97 family phage prohead protease